MFRSYLIGSTIVLGSLLCIIPTGSADEKLLPPTRKELSTSQNNLKQLVLAFHNYSDAYGSMPDNLKDKSGKAALSWRVQILPFIEEVALYQQFKLDEPWDSETNKKLIAKMPKLYAPVRVKAKEGETFYQVFRGEQTLYTGKISPRVPQSFPDGTSNTGLIFEAGEPVIWTKPSDLTYDPKKPLPKLGGLFDGNFQVGVADGSVIMCKKTADEATLRNFIMPADGNVLDMKKLQK